MLLMRCTPRPSHRKGLRVFRTLSTFWMIALGFAPVALGAASSTPSGGPNRRVEHPALTSPGFAPSSLLRTAGIVALSTLGDATMADELPEMRGRHWNGVARVSERLGNPLYLGVGIGLVWGVAHLSDRPGLAASALRIGAGTVAAGLAANLIKYPVGRARPFHSPDDSDEYRPLSGWNSFPSGHTTVAFGLAAGIDQETRAAWVPWVVYPAAGVVGWSRMRDNRHWLSDVVAGAILGPLVSRFVVRRLISWSSGCETATTPD